MINIKHIIVGWYRRFFKPMTQEEKNRLEICNACDNKIKIGNEWVCSRCYCPIKSKVRVEDELCDMNKW